MSFKRWLCCDVQMWNVWDPKLFTLAVTHKFRCGRDSLQMLAPHLSRQSSKEMARPTVTLPYVLFKINVFVISILFVKQRLLLRDTDNELVSHCGWCCCGRRDIRFCETSATGWCVVVSATPVWKNKSLFPGVWFAFYVKIRISHHRFKLSAWKDDPECKGLNSLWNWVQRY